MVYLEGKGMEGARRKRCGGSKEREVVKRKTSKKCTHILYRHIEERGSHTIEI